MKMTHLSSSILNLLTPFVNHFTINIFCESTLEIHTNRIKEPLKSLIYLVVTFEHRHM